MNIGKKLDGRYELTELIGIGGMADVYKAVDIMEDRTVAVKILKNEYSENEEFLRRFRNESKAIAVLSHPNIVKIYDVGFSDEIQYIVMEYIDGITLKEFIEQQGVLRWKDAIHFITQVLRALQHAHDRGIVHRDIKPQNIMLFSDGTIKVMDFGIARFSRSDGKTLSDKTIGSVHYISPEQARGDITDEKSDIYSVGVMLYEMLTGKKPFDADNPVAVALMHMQELAKNPREIISTIPEPLEEIVYHAMERNPSRRYQSASEMIKDIETFKHNPDVIFGYKSINDIDAPKSSESTIFFNPVKNDENTSDNNDIIDVDPNQPVDTYNNNYYPNEIYDDDDDEPVRKRSYVVPILSAVTVAVVIIAAVVILFMVIKSDAFGSNTNKIEVPNFIGQSIIDAKNEYGDKLQFIIASEEYNNDYPENIIFEQDIPAGTIKKEGAEIAVKVSKGPKTSVIPDLKNQTYEAAASELERLNLVPVQSLIHDDDVVEGRVIKTNPETNDEVPQGSSVTVFVSSGPLETKVKVPDVLGKTEEDARAKLEENKLKCEVTEVDTDEVEKGKVVTQSISEGTSVAKDTVITIGVSTGEAASKTVNIDVAVPVGAWGSYKILIYINGNLSNTQALGDAETVAGGSIRVPVTGQGKQAVSVKIQKDDDSALYGSYEVNFADGTYTATSTNASAFTSITPERETTKTTKKSSKDTNTEESTTTPWSQTTTNNAE